MIEDVLDDYIHWRRNYIPQDPIIIDRSLMKDYQEWYDLLDSELLQVIAKLKKDYPFYSPRYLGHMLSEYSMPGFVGYLAGMLHNPNNVTDEASPGVISLEIDSVKLIAEMLGYDKEKIWGHICSGGTIANLEALWVARHVQFFPLMVKEFCENPMNSSIDVTIGSKKISTYTYRELLTLNPLKVIEIFNAIQRTLESDKKKQEEFLKHLDCSCFNVEKKGLYNVLNNLDILEKLTDKSTELLITTPIVFAPVTAHYSLTKAMKLLGYGEESLVTIPVDENFRLNIEVLASEIKKLKSNQYIAAIVGVLGTTEEGAIDPIHKIASLRKSGEDENGFNSFWFHVDAAWGGYLASMFRGEYRYEKNNETASIPLLKWVKHSENLNENLIKWEFINEMIGTKRGKEAGDRTFSKAIWADELSKDGSKPTTELIQGKYKYDKQYWFDQDVYASILAVPDADSVTIDPHKLGYLPYPCGCILFKDFGVTRFIQTKATYLFDPSTKINNINDVKTIGEYIVEGSKPGAAAAACYLAHTTIPLDLSHHGKIMKTVVLNARRLNAYFGIFNNKYDDIKKELKVRINNKLENFYIKSLYVPDSNVVCFHLIPISKINKEYKFKCNDTNDPDIPNENAWIKYINAFNQALYERLNLEGKDTKQNEVFNQRYFVSKNCIGKNTYKNLPVEEIFSFNELNYITDTCFQELENGITVLRCTLMNPFYYAALKNDKFNDKHNKNKVGDQGMDYLWDFVKFMFIEAAKITDTEINKIFTNA